MAPLTKKGIFAQDITCPCQIISQTSSLQPMHGFITDLMGDPADYETIALADKDIKDRAALHEYVRGNKAYYAYEAWDIHETVINGVRLKSGEANSSKKVIFSGEIVAAEDMRVYTDFVTKTTVPYTDLNPSAAGMFFLRGDAHIHPLDPNVEVYDRDTGVKKWPRPDAPKKELDPKPL
jgi:hypothetical protein